MGRKKKKMGRPSTYDPIYAKKIIEFFDVEPILYKDVTITHKDGSIKEMTVEEAAPIPYFANFCKSIGISSQCLSEWKDKYPDFGEAYKRAKELQVQFISTNALRGNFNAVYAIFMMKNTHRWQDENSTPWLDKQTLDIPGKSILILDE